jgi:hypothetical protein
MPVQGQIPATANRNQSKHNRLQPDGNQAGLLVIRVRFMRRGHFEW